MIRQNIDIININDQEYPKQLKNIYDYPISLYIKGNSKILNNKSIAIIGCRKASEYGIKSAQYFAYNLARNNINIVSGLARGIDSYAHRGAINAKGKTIAVVGTGLDIVYPQENEKLSKNIEENGAIISEYPLGKKPEKMKVKLIESIGDIFTDIQEIDLAQENYNFARQIREENDWSVSQTLNNKISTMMPIRFLDIRKHWITFLHDEVGAKHGRIVKILPGHRGGFIQADRPYYFQYKNFR